MRGVSIEKKSLSIAAACLVLFVIAAAFPSNLSIGLFMLSGGALVIYQVWIVLKDETEKNR